MSIGFLLSSRDDAVVWRGPKKNGILCVVGSNSIAIRLMGNVVIMCRAHFVVSSSAMIKQFLTDVVWGKRDYLIIDTPPGTSDEHITVVEQLKAIRPDGAILVSTPQVSH